MNRAPAVVCEFLIFDFFLNLEDVPDCFIQVLRTRSSLRYDPFTVARGTRVHVRQARLRIIVSSINRIF